MIDSSHMAQEETVGGHVTEHVRVQTVRLLLGNMDVRLFWVPAMIEQ